MNYGETLAYWYLRLNGFFPLRSFVHHSPQDRTDRADCDVLAVRFPYVTEDLGGAPGDWDTARFDTWGLPLAHPIALVVQVKTGALADHGEAFSRERMVAALNRTGLWRGDTVTRLARDLDNAARVDLDGTRIAKLVIASSPCNHPAAHLAMTMRDAVTFIRRRFETYRRQKAADRLFFHDELVQFLASTDDRG